jgi:hypothetical protein
MVKRRPSGQGVSEYILMLAAITLLGVWIMKSLVGNLKGTGGTVASVSTSTTKKIASDER